MYWEIMLAVGILFFFSKSMTRPELYAALSSNEIKMNTYVCEHYTVMYNLDGR